MRPLCLLAFRRLCLAVSISFLPALGQAQEDSITRQTQFEAPAHIGVVRFTDGLLSVDLHEALLGNVLVEIAQQSGLVLTGSSFLTDKVTVKFDQLPLDPALHLILRGQSYGLFSRSVPRSGVDAARVQRELRIFPRHEGPRVEAAPVGSDGERAPLETSNIAALLTVLETSDDSWEKEDAIQALAESGRREIVLPMSHRALADEDQGVRLTAVYALATIGGIEAVQALTLALEDDDDGVRKQAVVALGNIGGEEAIELLWFEWARDWSQSVRDTAAMELERLGVRVH